MSDGRVERRHRASRELHKVRAFVGGMSGSLEGLACAGSSTQRRPDLTCRAVGALTLRRAVSRCAVQVCGRRDDTKRGQWLSSSVLGAAARVLRSCNGRQRDHNIRVVSAEILL